MKKSKFRIESPPPEVLAHQLAHVSDEDLKNYYHAVLTQAQARKLCLSCGVRYTGAYCFCERDE